MALAVAVLKERRALESGSVPRSEGTAPCSIPGIQQVYWSKVQRLPLLGKAGLRRGSHGADLKRIRGHNYCLR